MMHKKSEKGQAIVLIVFSIIGIIGLIALTVDGGRAYADRRSAQGAADSAAWAGGLANARHSNETMTISEIKSIVEPAALSITEQNGYPQSSDHSQVTVSVIEDPSGLCPPLAKPNIQITVEITSQVDMFFAPVIGLQDMTNRVIAITRACGTYKPAIFGGYAITSCGKGLNDQNPCGFNSGNSNAADWIVHGSGIHSDTCLSFKNSDSITLDEGFCLNGAGGVTAQDGSDTGDLVCGVAGSVSCNDDYVQSIMPPNPCDGDSSDGIVGLPQSDGVESSSGNGNNADTITFGGGPVPKVYCITNADALDGMNVVLDNATLYFTETDFNLSFAGGGGFSGTPSASGEFSGLAIVVALDATPCPGTSGTGANDAQQLEYRGNASGVMYGTILAPTACVDMRGNAGACGGGADCPLLVNGQVIGNAVTSNGNAGVTIDYVEDQNYRPPEEPTIILVQ